MKGNRGAGRLAASAGFFVLIAIATALLIKGLYPADLPESRNPDFVDNVFDNRAVLWAARLLLVSAAGVLAFGGIFIVVSIGIRMKNREWLRRAGPFEISEGSVGQVEEEVAFWRRVALTSQEEAAVLQEQVRQSKELIAELEDTR
jgi:hypothetical protein